MKFNRNVSQAFAKPKLGYRPQVIVIMPCKGLEYGLERNIEAVLRQQYESYRTLIVTDSTKDPAYETARAVLTRNSGVDAKLLTSEFSGATSGKVAALLTVLEKTAGTADVYAFIDSDALVPPNWLEELVDPLKDSSVGSTTGFRWYFPSHGDLWSHVEAAWNASGTNLLFDERYNFPWGGAMAVRAETLEKIGIMEVWSNAVTDDMTLNSALRKHRYRTVFLPQCTVATFNKTALRDLLKWATRQIVLTRVFNRGLWNYALAAYTFFDFAFVLGIAGLALGTLFGPIWWIPSVLLLSPEAIGIFRASQRCDAFKVAMPYFRREFDRNRFRNAMASFIVPWIMTYCIIKSVSLHEIEWRGRKYDLTET